MFNLQSCEVFDSIRSCLLYFYEALSVSVPAGYTNIKHILKLQIKQYQTMVKRTAQVDKGSSLCSVWGEGYFDEKRRKM